MRSHCERGKGAYSKHNLEYWESEIGQRRKQQRAASTSTSWQQGDELSDDTPQEDYSKMTITKLREIIREKGLKVKNLSKLKKQQLVAFIEKSSL